MTSLASIRLIYCSLRLYGLRAYVEYIRECLSVSPPALILLSLSACFTSYPFTMKFYLNYVTRIAISCSLLPSNLNSASLISLYDSWNAFGSKYNFHSLSSTSYISDKNRISSDISASIGKRWLSSYTKFYRDNNLLQYLFLNLISNVSSCPSYEACSSMDSWSFSCYITAVSYTHLTLPTSDLV